MYCIAGHFAISSSNRTSRRGTQRPSCSSVDTMAMVFSKALRVLGEKCFPHPWDRARAFVKRDVWLQKACCLCLKPWRILDDPMQLATTLSTRIRGSKKHSWPSPTDNSHPNFCVGPCLPYNFSNPKCLSPMVCPAGFCAFWFQSFQARNFWSGIWSLPLVVMVWWTYEICLLSVCDPI